MSVMKPMRTLSCAWAAPVASRLANIRAESVNLVVMVGLGNKGKDAERRSLPERALGFGLGREHLLARQRLDDLQVVPGLGRLLGALDLHEVHVVHEAAVGTDLALAEEVVDRRGLELGHDLVG